MSSKGNKDSASTRAKVDEADVLVSEDNEKFAELDGS